MATFGEDLASPYDPIGLLKGAWEQQWRQMYANKILRPGNVTHLPGTGVLERTAQQLNSYSYPTWMGLPIAINRACPKGQTILFSGKTSMVVFHDVYDLHATRFWLNLTPRLVEAELEAKAAWQRDERRTAYRLARITNPS